MKNTLLLAIALFFVSVNVLAQEPWVKINSKEGKFSILFPRQPVESEQTVETEIGPLTLNLIMYEVGNINHENVIYGIIYSDYPDSIINSEFGEELVESFFDNSTKGAATNMKGTIVSEKKITYKNYPGRSVKMSLMDGEGIMNMHIFLVKNRGYILQVGCETKNDNNAAIDKFFSSFVLESQTGKK